MLLKRKYKPHLIIKKKKFHIAVATVLLVVILINVFQFWSVPLAQGATYTFVQNDWSGGVSNSVIVHPDNQTGWNSFSTSTNIFTSGTTTVSIASTTYTSTDDGTFSSTGSATGGGFSNGITSTVSVVGSGSSASIKLSGSTTPVNRVTATTSISGVGFHGGAQMVGSPDSDYLYIIEGGNRTSGLRRYSISNNTTTVLANYPYAYFGAQLLWNGSDDYIYLAEGQNNKFDRYSISGNSWSSMANFPTSLSTDVSETAALRYSTEDFIYFFRGSGFADFYRYSISGNSWSSLTSLPVVAGYGIQAVRDASSDFIYVVPGNGTNFYRYSISGDSWLSMAALPGSIGITTNAGVLHDEGSDYIYLLSNNSFYRYSISDNSWVTMADASAVNPDYGSTLLHNSGDDTIYVTGEWTCCSPVKVWGYSISGNSWTAYYTVAGHNGNYGSPNKTAYRRTSDESFYFLTASGLDGDVFKYTISQTIYNSSGNFTSASLDLGVAKMNSLSWTSTTPSGVGNNSIQFQLAANNDNSTWNYVGPDGTASTFFTTNGTTSFPSSLLNKRYWSYKAFLSTADTTVSPSLDSVIFSYSSYATSSSLISSIYDTVDPTNVLASIAWSLYVPTSTTIKFQLRTGASTSSIASATWVGPDGTNSSFFTNSSGETTTSTMRDGSGDRYFQYKTFLATTNSALTPVLSSVTTTYVVNANPEIQNVSASENGSGVVSITYQARDPDTSTGTINPGFVSSTFEYLDANGVYQTIPASQLSAGANNNLAVQGVVWTTSTVSWTLPAGLNIAASRIRVTVNDNEAANNTAATTSPTFQIDSVAPSATSIIVDGSETPAVLTFNVSDSSTLFMKVSENSSLSDVSTWSAFTATTTFSLSSNPSTVYAQFKDVYGNTSTIIHATTPQTPNSFILQDNSNVRNGATDYRLFIAWRVVATPSPGFGSYKVYRSEDQVNWSLISTISSISDNFVTDNTTLSDTLYHYRVKTVDADGNSSIFSSTIDGRANGAQDAGEGGGGSGVASDPTITSVATSSPTPSSITVTWDTDVLSNSIVGFSTTPGNFTDNLVTVGSMVNSASGSIGAHTVVLGGLTPNTTYYFSVKSVTASSASSTSNNGGNGYIFRTPSGPTITGVSAAEVNNTFARIVWSTSENSDSSVIFSTSTSLTNPITTSSSQLVTSHDITLTGLTAGTRYYFFVQSVNGSGVTSTDKNLVNGIVQNFNLATTLDSTGPVISSIATSTSDNSANITWNTNESADSQIIYGTTTNYGSTTTLDSTFTSQHLVIISGLNSSTIYHFKILSRDKNSNSSASSDQIITTSATPDTTAPIISSVATSTVSLTGATVIWTTNELASSIIEYGINTSSYSSLAGSNSDLATSHSVSLTGLSGNTAYYFRVRSADSVGNSALSDNSGQGWQFLTVADTTGPVISDISLLVNDTSVAISWTTNEESSSEVDYDLTSSTFGFSSSTASLVTNHTVTISGLTTNNTYYFRLKSTDSSGNTTIDNNGGAAYSFATQQTPGIVRIGTGGGGAARDTEAPQIGEVSIVDIAPSSATVIWETNEEGNSLVRFGSSIKYGSLTGNDSELLTSKHSVSLFDLKPGQIYHLKAVTYDASGNRAESVDKTFSTLNSDGSEIAPSTSTEKIPEEVTPETQFISDSLQKASSASLEKFLRDIASNPFLKNVPQDKFIQAMFEMTSKVVEAPTIVGVKPTVEVKGTTAIIKWSTDKKSTSELNYAKDVDYKPNDGTPYTNAAVNPDEFSINHTVELSGLDPGVLYHFKVSSKGLIGPAAVSGDYTFLTTGDLPIISNIKVTRPNDAQSSIIVGWRTNIPTAGTVEYKNAKSKQSLTQGDETLLINHEVTLKGLEGGVNYTLIVRAKDEFKNEVSSLPITFSTLLDKVNPTIAKLSSESTLYPGKDSKVQTIISWETDEPATSQVFYQEGLAGDNAVSLPLDSSLNTRHVVVITKFKPGTVYKYWVESKDLAGNTGKSEIFSILTPQQKETIVDIIINNFQSVFGWTKNIGA